MGAPSKRAKKIRSASEFDLVRLSAELRSPRQAPDGFSWPLAAIFNARDDQMAGRFKLPARLAESMRTDDAIFTAWENRLAPQRCIPVEIRPAGPTARAGAIAGEGEALFGQGGVGVHPDTISDIHGTLVDHGIAFGVNVVTPRADGSRWDFEIKMYPIEFIRWDPIDRCYKAQVDPMGQPAVTQSGYQAANVWEEPIVHGDGRWSIFRKHELYPFRKEACVLAGAVVWARHALAGRDWAKGSTAHGNAKVIGEMPPETPLQDKDGGLTPEAAALLELLKAIASVDSPVGIRPAGAKTDYLTNNSNAWQVWKELIENAERAAARIYLGTDGTLGTVGGAPGVDIESLFGVAATKVEGDLRALERGILTGVIEPWAAVNFGDSSLAPQRCYLIPDGDEDARDKAFGERTKSFFDALKTAKDAGINLTQDYVNGLAADFKVRAPVLPTPAVATAPAQAAPTPLRAI